MSHNSDPEEVIFDQAVTYQSDAERGAFLNEACRGNGALRARLDALMEGHFKAPGFFARPLTPNSTNINEAIGSVIGRYRLIEKIGEGGFGVVYVAEQSEPVTRKVALKLIKLGMDTRQVVARFEAERQALALMEHPSIARVFDGGMTDGGRPYFVMELVAGIPITKFCNENHLAIRQRLEVFVQVCRAVQHAHQKGIIHRDLKPSNILITLNDGVALPKVIDFGIAKAIHMDLAEKTVFTQDQHFIGTPAYMSPEQAEMTSIDVDTRSDIYSLGVLLYELLTGKTPFDGKDLLASGLDGMRRTIREMEPLKPSARTPGASLSAACHIDRDLDWIVMKCLEKDRARRYETTSALAVEIERHLKNEPVLARPPSAAYRFGKFARRHKLQLSAATFALAMLLLGLALSAWQALEARRERARAERHLQETVHFMDSAFDNMVPALSYTIGAAKPSQDLANAAVQIAQNLEQDSNLNPDLRRALARLYLRTSLLHSYYLGNTTGDYLKGLEFARRAVRFFEPTTNANLEENELSGLAMAQMSAGFACKGLLRPEEALEYFTRMRRTAELLNRSPNSSFAQLGSRHDQAARALTGWTILQMNKSKSDIESALANFFIPLLNEVSIRVSNLDTADLSDLWDLRDCYDSIGRAQLQLGRAQESLAYFRRALELSELNDRRHPNHAACVTMFAESKARLGEALLSLAMPEEAALLFDAALQRAQNLRKLDPLNAGFVQLEVQILLCRASGMIAWARTDSTSGEDRSKRLTDGQESLNQAQDLVKGLKSESLRNYLRHHLSETHSQLQNAAANLRSSGGGAI